MPTNKNAMTRYKILDDLLSNRYHNYSLDDLTEELNRRLNEMDIDSVTRRCVEKDIHYLEYEGPFLVDIERYSAPGYSKEKQRSYVKKCLRYSNPSFSIFKKDLTDDEEYLLSEALSLLGQFDGLPNLDGLEGLRFGLGVKRKRKIISLTKNPLENSSLLGQLFTAISQKQVIELSYHTFNSDEIKKIVVHPYLLKEYYRRWFLFSAADTDDKLLCFSLDRIDGVKPLPSYKYREYKGDLSSYFDDIIGVTLHIGQPVEHILFWVSDNSCHYVETKPLHDSQIMYKGDKADEIRASYPSLSGGAFFSIDCVENYELIRELCSFGPELVVLSPDGIRKEIVSRLRKMTGMYEIDSKRRNLK